MNKIANIEIIDIEKLDQKKYFKSLVQELYETKYIDANDIIKIQMEVIECMRFVVGKLTGKDSYTIKVDRASVTMDSVYFTLGVYFKTIDSKTSLEIIKNGNLLESFKKGFIIIQDWFNKYKKFILIVKENMLNIPNVIYLNNTVMEIDEFFNNYDILSDSANIINEMSYPLCIENINLIGIEYMKEYLDNFNLENLFLMLYDINDINRLIKNLSNYSETLVINIFKLVLIVSIFEEYLNHEEYHLNLNILEVEEIYMKLSPKSSDEIEMILNSLINKIMSKLSINGKMLSYIGKCKDLIIDEIIVAINNDKLDYLLGIKKII